MKFAHRSLSGTFLLALALLFIAVVPARAELLDRIVAKVNGDIITLYELQAAATPELMRSGLNRGASQDEPKVREVYSRVLDLMISDILLFQEAEKLQITAGQDEIENELRTLIQRTGLSPAAYEQQLKTQGATLDTVRTRIRKNILQNRLTTIMITRKIVVTQDEIKAYYDANQAHFTTARSLELAMLPLSRDADAQAVADAVNSGNITFEQAISQYSTSPNASNGGAIGTLKWSDISAEWQNALGGVQAGAVSRPITAANGSQILLKVVNIIQGRALTIEEATPEIEARLREPKLAQRAEEYIKQLRDKAVIDILL